MGPSIPHLTNGQNWINCPTEVPNTTCDVISLESSFKESSDTVLVERNSGWFNTLSCLYMCNNEKNIE